MTTTFLMAAVLLAACVLAVFLLQRLLHSASRVSTLRDELAQNEDQMRQHMQRLQDAQQAQSSTQPPMQPSTQLPADQQTPDDKPDEVKEI